MEIEKAIEILNENRHREYGHWTLESGGVAVGNYGQILTTLETCVIAEAYDRNSLILGYASMVNDTVDILNEYSYLGSSWWEIMEYEDGYYIGTAALDGRLTYAEAQEAVGWIAAGSVD